MISLLFGLPGSGKSLLLSYIAFRAINKKRINFRGFHISTLGELPDFKEYDRVYTNFPCEGGYKLDFEALGYVDYHNCLMLIDEVQLFADSRNFKNFGDNLKLFFSLHRKFKIDIVMCTQSLSAVDARLRSLTQCLYYVDSLGKFIRVREIISYFDVDRTIQEGYEYARGFNTKYFFAPKLYQYNDTFCKVKELKLKEPKIIPWDFQKDITTAAEKSIEELEEEPPIKKVPLNFGTPSPSSGADGSAAPPMGEGST